MPTISHYIQRIQELAKRNQELNNRLTDLMGQYSIIKEQNKKYNQLLDRYSEPGLLKAQEKSFKKRGKRVERLNTVSLLYISIRGFEELPQMSNQSELIDILDEINVLIKEVADKFSLTKIKSFGDNIIYAAGLNRENRTNPIDITLAACHMKAEIQKLYERQAHKPIWKVKMGIHTGPILAFDEKRAYSPYSISGENINIVCRLGESCPAGKINISEMTYELVKEFFNLTPAGTIPVKFKGPMKIYQANGLQEKLHQKDNIFASNKMFDLRYRQIQFMDIQEEVLNLLEKNLPNNLYYHNIKHTIDVITEVELIGWAEGLKEEEILILKTAALFHDAGHIVDYRTHEYQSVLLARQILPRYNFSKSQLDVVERLILATKFPPTPKDKLEEVICDSDLDYLGRADFIPVSNNLYKELKERQMIGSWNEWLQMQLDFIMQHQYYTQTAKKLREVNKQQQIERLRLLLKNEVVKTNY